LSSRDGRKNSFVVIDLPPVAAPGPPAAEPAALDSAATPSPPAEAAPLRLLRLFRLYCDRAFAFLWEDLFAQSDHEEEVPPPTPTTLPRNSGSTEITERQHAMLTAMNVSLVSSGVGVR
jgi:hypothetical protein